MPSAHPPSPPPEMPPANVSLGSYLFRRIQQLGVSHIYGVPGDFTLKALDQLTSTPGLRFVGCCNELNAGYAADGYARVQRWKRRTGGLGAVFTTWGVGELSAANAIACSYAEHVPIVHIVGSPSARAFEASAASGEFGKSHLHIHHALKDSRSNVFHEIAEKFTVAQLNLADFDAKSAPGKVDWVLTQAIQKSRPVYIQLPADQTNLEVSSHHLLNPLPESDEIVVNGFTFDHVKVVSEALADRLYAAKRPMILVDRGDGVEDMREEIIHFVEQSGLPTLALPSGAGMIPTNTKNYFGLHSGKIGAIDTLPFVHDADLVLAFGPMFADSQTLAWTNVPKRPNMIIIGKSEIDAVAVDSKQVIQKLTKNLDKSRLPEQDVTSLGNFRAFGQPQVPHELVNQDNFYKSLSSHLRENDTVILGTATPTIGGRDLVLPEDVQVIAAGLSLSIGQMLPGAFGASQAASASGSGRTILLEGDGNFQVTAQELSTIIYERLNAIIFIINNDGYTYERMIHGPNEEYNDIAPWNYLAAPDLFGGAPSGYSINKHRVETWKDLDGVLNSEAFKKGEGLVLVEVIMGRMDIPSKAMELFTGAGKTL